MSRDIASAARRHAVKNPGEATLYSQGGELVLVACRHRSVGVFDHLGTRDEVQAETVVLARRTVSSAGLANRVHERFSWVLQTWPQLGLVRSLEHAIVLVQSELRVASRRMGRRVR